MVSFGDVPGQGVWQRWQAGRGFLSVVGAIHAVTVSGAKYQTDRVPMVSMTVVLLPSW
jgi:hypothetical protein